METIFPKHDGYKGIFFIGYRKDPNNPTKTERVGTVVLKRTYDIAAGGGTEAGRLTPSTDAHDIFFQDQMDLADYFDNLVANSDFSLVDENGKLAHWQADSSLIIEQVEENDNHFMRVTTSVSGRVFQAVSLPEQLGGRKFVLRFNAKADDGVTVRVRLEAGGETICDQTVDPGTDFRDAEQGLFSATGKWPESAMPTDMDVVMEILNGSGQAVAVHFDDVSLHPLIRYEHDMCSFKPEGDLMVLDYTNRLGQSTIKVNNSVWLRRTIGSTTEPDLFGWESRYAAARKNDVGTFSDNPDDYPPEWPVVNPDRDPLPPDFKNRFYCGYRRDALASGMSAVPYLIGDESVEIGHDGISTYRIQLRGDTVEAVCYAYSGSGPDAEAHWQAVPVTMNIDTLVLEPEKERCCLIWRGVWNFDMHPEANYRRLGVTATP